VVAGNQSVKRARPVVGLDKPCRQCGRPIYFNYRGPIEGVCGKCTDRALRGARRRPRGRVTHLADRSPRKGLWVFLVLAVIAAAALTTLLLPRIL